MGLTRSHERGRVPPEDKSLYTRVMDCLFHEGDNLIQMSDSAAAFLQDHVGVLERFNVNHSIKEWTKHVRPIWNVRTQERRACLCSTNFADSTWQKTKASIPKGIKSSTAGSRRTKMRYVRACQWRVIVQEEDRWGAFCAASKQWRQHHDSHPQELIPAGTVTFGFDATGEVNVLRKEEELRTRRRDQVAPEVPLRDVTKESAEGWSGDESDCTDSNSGADMQGGATDHTGLEKEDSDDDKASSRSDLAEADPTEAALPRTGLYFHGEALP